MTDRYAVIGNPIAHSRSPDIHRLFAQQTGDDVTYERLLAPIGALGDTLDAFRAQGGKGANITLPFKEDAWRYADLHSPFAERAGAVNTLRFDGAACIGDNTDGIGLMRDIEHNLGTTIAGRRVLLVGAGGAARGALAALIDAAPRIVVVVNRTPARAQQLVARLGAGQAVEASNFASLDDAPYDLVINATAAGIAGEALPLPDTLFAAGTLAYDMMYGTGATPFMLQARAAGARAADGLGMLVEQAAESFFLWRGTRPDTAPVLAQLRA